MVELFGILKVFFKTRLELINALNIVDNKGASGDLFANGCNANGIAVAHKSLNCSIIDGAGQASIAIFDGTFGQLKRGVFPLSVHEPCANPDGNGVKPNPDNHIFNQPTFSSVISIVHKHISVRLFELSAKFLYSNNITREGVLL